MRITLKNRRVMVRKCVNDHVRDENGDVLIYKPDEVYEDTNTCEVVDVADDCRIFQKEHIGGFVEMPEYIEGFELFNKDLELWIADERILDDVIETGAVFFEE